MKSYKVSFIRLMYIYASLVELLTSESDVYTGYIYILLAYNAPDTFMSSVSPTGYYVSFALMVFMPPLSKA